MENRIYLCIDLKSFYASCECVDRNLDPLVTNLVVADASRTDKTICLAVTPSLKSFGIPGRARLFEVNQKVKEINNKRIEHTKNRMFNGFSYNLNELNNDPSKKLDFIIATPKMSHYLKISSKIYGIYLKYISKDDIHVYSIDEVFMDVTSYLKTYKMTPYQLAMVMIKDVLKETGITATAGIGTNMYLAKVAMDIVAKKKKADKDGVRVAMLDEKKYRQELWEHTPLTDFWRVGKGIASRLEKLDLYTMGDIARCSLGKSIEYHNEDLLYKEFGINAELLIDHAWGKEETTIKDIKEYIPKSNSMSSSQVLSKGYKYDKAKLIAKEMADVMSFDLVAKNMLTNSISLILNYDVDNLKDEDISKNYHGQIEVDYLGRKVPKCSHGAINFDKYTFSSSKIIKAISVLFDNIANPSLLIRRVTLVANNLINYNDYKGNENYQQMSLFDDETLNKKDEKDEKKEKKLQETILTIQKKYGKNSVLKVMNLEKDATTKERNKQIGGHKS